MLSERLTTILPDLTFEEALEITKIHSISGELDSSKGLITSRPFRRPHHTSSPVSIIGGGRIPKPGEISLAHFGVLFLDEIPEFKKNTLEVLRGPVHGLYLRAVLRRRLQRGHQLPVRQVLPGGYMGQISGPLLDRIDLHIEVKPVEYKKISSDEATESSATIKERVNKARKIQLERYKEYDIYSNSELTPSLLEKFCKIDKVSKEILKKAFERLGLSGRAYGRILKVARSIADLDEEENIKQEHILEAIQYRSLDRKYWKR